MIRPLLLLSLVTLSQASIAGTDTVLEVRAREISKMVAAEPTIDPAIFDKTLLKQLPITKLAPIFAGFFEKHGSATGVILKGRDSEFSGRFELSLEREVVMPMSLTLAAQPPHAVIGLWFGAPSVPLKDFDAVVAELAKLPGRTGFECRELGVENTPVIAARNAEETFAIGSSFKLYVLGALAQAVETGRRKLGDVIQLTPATRSLPSGRMHTWPAGSPVTLHTLAVAMISESDNTATDTLMQTLTRAACEAILEPMHNTSIAQNKPFLTTGEMFKLKLTNGGKWADAYLERDELGRRKLLANELAQIELRPADLELQLLASPSHIDTIEWFASPRDMVAAMDALRTATEPGKQAAGLREVLSVNPGLPAMKDVFEWVGFKGGSETGVLNATFLLRARNGRTFALSAAWNDPQAALDEERFFAIVGRAGQLLARHAAAEATSK
ncbi:MAG: serine hydrolase [Planctomycetes bacterium]|nr:serine hydrolase [Planctomycetota bacterium]